MTPDPAVCPLCQARQSFLEHLAHGWMFCNCCGRAFLLGGEACDRLLNYTETDHAGPKRTVAVSK